MFEKPSLTQLRAIADELGMHPSDDYLAAVERITGPLAAAYAALDAMPDELPPVKYPRDGFHRPSAEENRYGAWYVKTAIKGAARGKLAGRRVVLTGGASQLQGVREMAAQVLDKQVRLGRPGAMPGLAESTYGPAFSTAAGILLHVAQANSGSAFADFASFEEPNGFIGRIGHWIRDNL